MCGVLSLVLAMTFIALFIHDYRKTSVRKSVRYMMRNVVNLGSLLVLVSGFFLGRRIGLDEFLLDISVADGMVMNFQSSLERPRTALRFSLLAIAVNIVLRAVLSFLAVFQEKYGIFLIVSVNLLLLLCYSLALTRRKFSSIRGLFRNNAVWANVEEYSRFFYVQLFLGFCILALSSRTINGQFRTVVQAFSAFLLTGLYVLLYLKSMSGRSMVMGKVMEGRIKDAVNGGLKPGGSDRITEDRKMQLLYKRVVDYMEEKKPYLDSSFTMAKMAEELYSNKLYLSRTVNQLSGRNFRQFVNYHRIRYAVDLMKQDPRLKILEVSEMSGFHTVVSFNMAFKLNMGLTPTDWMDRYLSGEDV